MKVKIQVVIESDDGRVQDVAEVACLKRSTLTPEELGLNLAEAKQILQNVQQSMVGCQAAAYQAEQKQCPQCGRGRPQKGRHEIVFRTLFGRLKLPSLRLYRCPCEAVTEKTFSPLAELLTERTALSARFPSRLSKSLGRPFPMVHCASGSPMNSAAFSGMNSLPNCSHGWGSLRKPQPA